LETNNPEGWETTTTPEQGWQKLIDTYRSWNEMLGGVGIQATYAIIAANWAVHSRADRIINNTCALWSIAICIVVISVNVLLVWLISQLLSWRIRQADEHVEWWTTEHKKRSESRWPFSRAMEGWSFCRRIIISFGPIVAGILFILSLFPKGRP